MLETSVHTHWLLVVAREAGRLSGEEPVIDSTTPIGTAWRLTALAAGISEEQLATHVASHFHLFKADLAAAQLHAGDLVPERLARQRVIFALRESERHLVVATADPTDLETEQLVAFVSGRNVVFELAPPGPIQEAIDARYAPERAVARLLSRVGAEMSNEVRVVHERSPEVIAPREAEAAPVVRLTNLILADAVRARASDIHLEPVGEDGRVRFRVDGILQPYTSVSRPILNRVVSALKIMGDMDIADRLRPQDGRARISVQERPIDLRLSTVPTRDSEKAVVRLLDPMNTRRLEDLALSSAEVGPLRSLISRRDGIVLVTGPTGSGKTTLLYAALRELPVGELNVTTVEDPVEYELPGITQIQVEPSRNVTFASALRSILRQDPDVVFIGEIRDAETAAIAVQASLTGHLVLASLHTNDAVGAVARLGDLGVPRAEIASTLRGATAQRLVRKVCPDCAHKIVGPLNASETKLASRYGVTPVVRAVGCRKCAQTGYLGRIPLLEVMVVGSALERAILDGASTSQLQSVAIGMGMRPLSIAATDRVRMGETTLEEIERELGETEPENSRGVAVPHVLLADDDPVTRSVAKALLVANGFTVSEAADGIETLEQIEKARDISLVVLDLGMPRLSGQDVLRRLRGSVATSALPVVVLTGATDDQTEIDAMDAGADDYVRKPLAADRFVARIKAVLRRNGQ